MNWTVRHTDAFIRQAARLVKRDPSLLAPIGQCIEQLQSDPRHPGLKLKRLRSLPDRWEARVNKDIRIIFAFRRSEIILLAIGHHDDVLP